MVEDDNSTLSNLGGEMAPGSWDFLAPHGPLPNPVGHVFPIMSHDGAGDWRLIGTGFHIGPRGLFVTAKHVIEDVFGNCRIIAGKQLAPLAVLRPSVAKTASAELQQRSRLPFRRSFSVTPFQDRRVSTIGQR